MENMKPTLSVVATFPLAWAEENPVTFGKIVTEFYDRHPSDEWAVTLCVCGEGTKLLLRATGQVMDRDSDT